MSQNDRWLLPEGIDELLPAEAARLEGLRRRLLDLFDSWGYDQIVPPLIEYLDSLLTGAGNDLDLQTFKLIDQSTGRLMGVRADMTPQAARIDAHRLRRDTPNRLCYLGNVLHTRPDGFDGSRSPLQVGAELYGHGGVESDVEVISLMVEALRAAGIERMHLDLGHVGIFRGLAQAAGVSGELESALFDALQRKAVPEIESLLGSAAMTETQREMFAALATLNGGEQVLDTAEGVLREAGAGVSGALSRLRSTAEALRARLPGVALHFDLAELRGYAYHTGAVFAVFVPGRGQAIAQGGRYDDIGRVFGRARPATGFSTDLKTLMMMSAAKPAANRGIFAPGQPDPGLERRIAELRNAGERVVRELPGQSAGPAAMGCDRLLVERDGAWHVVPAGA